VDFVGNSEEQVKQMLTAIGVSDIMQLFRSIPSELILDPPKQNDGISEFEGLQLLEKLAAKNTFLSFENYLGAGAYEHHVPSIVSAICGKSEFLTSYTPYQAEASQGVLQAIFEYQSSICALTGMDVANASVYDGASACAEALLMALRCRPGKNKILVSETLHPHYREVIKLYLGKEDIHLQEIPYLKNGVLDRSVLESCLDDQTAALIIASPNFFGNIEDVQPIVQMVHSKGALMVLSANPMAYGLYASAGELGIDIAVGDCQPFGIPLQFGGPYVGYMACKQEFVRQLPGRIVGKTLDINGKEGFVLTLQAREQYIRREKATSNICTNQTLSAIAALISILWYGKQGLREIALANYQRASYLREKVIKIPGISPKNLTYFNEFSIELPISSEKVIKKFQQNKIVPGLDLGIYFPHLKNVLLIAVTETKNKQQLDHYVETMRKIVSEA
jgi:glycine dehydrogenase subunit 1